jgi:pyruvate kinase
MERGCLKKTKIICTIGPASLSGNMLKKMFRAGMNGARINTAYGTLDEYRVMINSLREVADIPIILDLKGPEIRLKTKGKMIVNKNDILRIGKNGKIDFNSDIFDKIDAGDVVLIDNGKLMTQVVEKQKGVLKLLAATSGEIEDGKGVNIPHKRLEVPTLSSKDVEIVKFAKECEVEFMALSFTRNARDVNNLRRESSGFEGSIIAKIENYEGVDKFDEILEAADGIMVARGDLGVELEPEKVPHIQKSIIRKCNQKGKLVVTATEMLESMRYQPTPTRAEVSDVANAILDGTDVTMLSGETAVGRYPVESVLMMSRIAKEAEKTVESHVEDEGFINISDTISKAVQRVCQEMPLGKVVTLTRSGYTARMISRFKILQPIIAVAPSKLVKKQLELSFGVCAVHFDYLEEDDRIRKTARALRAMGLVEDQETVLFTAAFRTTKSHSSNLIEIHKVEELTS